MGTAIVAPQRMACKDHRTAAQSPSWLRLVCQSTCISSRQCGRVWPRQAPRFSVIPRSCPLALVTWLPPLHPRLTPPPCITIPDSPSPINLLYVLRTNMRKAFRDCLLVVRGQQISSQHGSVRRPVLISLMILIPTNSICWSEDCALLSSPLSHPCGNTPTMASHSSIFGQPCAAIPFVTRPPSAL